MANTLSAPRRPPRLYASGIVKLIVDNEKEPYYVHKDLLTYYSPSFRDALSDGSQDARSNIVRTDKSLFWAPQLFLHWLYRERLPEEQDEPDLYRIWTTNLWHVVQVCIFCHLYNIQILKRKALDHLYKLVEERGLPLYKG
ncbi:hypothetical protein B5807_03576 [Epicoccum nigrum]|uniref:BTB domain-containing protein n=1 Tax=Epicoccum nigrum TaxID=105696 RepID=A0A1Y2M5D1_EPING|nr:hypothetical protein B5807_03576 [Epicoccum nigrum]